MWTKVECSKVTSNFTKAVVEDNSTPLIVSEQVPPCR